jgi:hypothetical protein
MIPIYSPAQKLLQYVTAENLAANASHFRLVRNRRGHVTRAYLRVSMSFDTRPFSRLGAAIEQPLSTGHVWALCGVRGSAGN